MSWKQRRHKPSFGRYSFGDDWTNEDQMATKHRPEHHAEVQAESPMDYAQHEATYGAFLTAVKWTIIGTAATLVVLYFLIKP